MTSNTPSTWRQNLRSLWQRPLQDDPIVDGLRGLSIVLIILFHCFYGVMAILRKPDPILKFLRDMPQIFNFTLGSDKAVDIFFVLSAFLLGTSLFRTLNAGKTLSVGEFYIRRLARIYPLFLLAIAAYFGVSVERSLNNLVYNLLFIDNFDGRSIIPVGWSLSIEMQFYLVLPWLSFFIFRLSATGRHAFLWFLFLVSMLIPFLICLRYPVIYETPFYRFHPDIVDPRTMMDAIYYPTQARFGPLLIGLILALRKVEGRRPPKYSALITTAGLLLMFAMLNFPVYRPESFYYQDFSTTVNLVLQSWHRSFFCLGLFMVLVTLSGDPAAEPWLVRSVRQFLGWRVWRPFAQAVFPIYLFHFPMIALAGLAVFQTTRVQDVTTVSMGQVGMVFLLASIFSLMFGALLHVTIEKPCMDKGYALARRYRLSKQRGPAESGSLKDKGQI